VIDSLRETVCALHAELPRNGLVAWTSGNLSARVPDQDLMVIKPSGVLYDDLTPESMVVCDLFGARVEGDLTPSSDAATHGYIYRALPEVGGVAHTHSAYATAWAVHGEPIPCVLTAMADEFGGPIPVGPFALIGDEEIGRGVVETLAGTRSPAVLMRSHGVFTVGPGPREAIKAAVMCEDVARTVHLARSLGEVTSIGDEEVEALHDRYQNVYGQR
jgi:L-ribulose-5-phosphate 4-epimerase